MTNPTRKRVVTLDDLNVLNQNAAYARQKGEEASAAAQLADTARQNLEALGGDTQAAGQQATQAAQAATLAKNSATAAALQASQAAGDAVTAAELAEGAAGTANQAAGAATTAAQRITDAVLDLSGLKVDIEQTVDGALAHTAQTAAAQGQATQLAFAELEANLRANLQGVTTSLTVARPASTSVFAQPLFATGPVDGQKGYTLKGTGSAVVSSGALVIDSTVFDGAKSVGVVVPHAFSEGIIRTLWAAGSQPTIQWGGPAEPGDHYAVWSNGGQVETGWWKTHADSSVSDVHDHPSKFAVPAGDFYIEIIQGPVVDGSVWMVRTWGADQPRPADAFAYIGFSTGNMPMLPEGPILLGSLGGPATLKSIVIDDYSQSPNPLQAKATFVGPWLNRFETGVNVLATFTSGSALHSTVHDTPGYAVMVGIPLHMTQPPVLAARFREQGTKTWSAYVRTQVPQGNAGDVRRVDVLSGLDPTKWYEVETAANVHEQDQYWMHAGGLCIRDIVVADGGTCLPADLSRYRTIELVGDSIFHGVVALCQPGNIISLPTTMVAEESVGRLAVQALGMLPLPAAYGGTGVTVKGSGDMPKAVIASNGYMYTRQNTRMYLPRAADYSLIEHGINDTYANPDDPARLPPSAEQFRLGYRELVLSKMARGSRPICITPFNPSRYSPIIAEVAAELGAIFIDTTGWIRPEDTVDGTHLTVAGAHRLAALLAAAMMNAGIWKDVDLAA